MNDLLKPAEITKAFGDLTKASTNKLAVTICEKRKKTKQKNSKIYNKDKKIESNIKKGCKNCNKRH